MLGVVNKFFLASLFMWVAPLLTLYGFKHELFPGISQLSPASQTLLSGFLAVMFVNIVIGVYIFLAIKEPSHSEHKPDAAFLAQAKASVSQPSESKSKSAAPDKED